MQLSETNELVNVIETQKTQKQIEQQQKVQPHLKNSYENASAALRR